MLSGGGDGRRLHPRRVGVVFDVLLGVRVPEGAVCCSGGDAGSNGQD